MIYAVYSNKLNTKNEKQLEDSNCCNTKKEQGFLLENGQFKIKKPKKM